MNIYIRSAGNISPQHSLDKDAFFLNRVSTSNSYFRCLEPEYDRFVDSKMIRRMSRIVKMGVAAAMTCLKQGGIENPAAILTATAYGCLEDTSSFLRRMIEFEEKLLSPTAFIQSTHNTVGAQIALLLKCYNYNNCIVHRGFSFENALTESALLLEEGMGPVLVGAIDEITDDSHKILSRFGLYKRTSGSEGNKAGEGAAFFLLDKVPGENPQALLKDLQILYKPENNAKVSSALSGFLKSNGIVRNQVGLVLTSQTGNTRFDEVDEVLNHSLLQGIPAFPYKSLCGDYPTASAFALWLASCLLKEQKQPAWMTGLQFPLSNILIHHRNSNTHHSFFLISAC